MTHDVIVVGGSYAGLSAAMQLARARRRVLVIDSGKRRNRFARAMHGFLGQDGVPPDGHLRVATKQLLAYPTVKVVPGGVSQVNRQENGFAVSLSDNRSESARRLVLATGLRDDLPQIQGIEERWGEGVATCPYCHGYEFGDKPLGVIANHADVSPHQAMLLPDWGPTTYFTQGAFEPDAEQTARFTARGIRIESSPVVELLGKAPGLSAVRLADGRTLPMAAAFLATKTSMASPLAAQLGCAFEDGIVGSYIRTDEWRQTSVPGVYAAGDAASPLHVISLAVASGTMAGVGAHNALVEEDTRSRL